MSAIFEAAAPAGYFDRLLDKGMHPGWAKREPAMWPAPRQTYVPAVWRMADARAALAEACSFVSPEFAERRNLILANPVEGNTYPTCATLVAAYQLVMPGETARSHRHTPNALRFVLESTGGMATLVNGLRVDMAPGDIVLTPQMQWHGHDNRSESAAFWIDILDVPFVQKLENIFFQHHPDTVEAVVGDDADSVLRLKATDTIPAAREARTVRVGEGLLPTIDLEVCSIGAGERTVWPASLENCILIVMNGSVLLDVAPIGQVELQRGDVAVVPSWRGYSITGTDSAASLLRVSDAPIFRKLGFRDPTRPF